MKLIIGHPYLDETHIPTPSSFLGGNSYSKQY